MLYRQVLTAAHVKEFGPLDDGSDSKEKAAWMLGVEAVDADERFVCHKIVLKLDDLYFVFSPTASIRNLDMISYSRFLKQTVFAVIFEQKRILFSL